MHIRPQACCYWEKRTISKSGSDSCLWKEVLHWDGLFQEDRRLQMGTVASAHNAQRVAFLSIELLIEAADGALPDTTARHTSSADKGPLEALQLWA